MQRREEDDIAAEYEDKMAVRADSESKWVEKDTRWSKTRSSGRGIQEFEALVDFIFSFLVILANLETESCKEAILEFCTFPVTSEMFVLILECSPPI